MEKKEKLLDILLRVQALEMDVESAEQQILQLFDVKKSQLDLRELERKLDDALKEETKETLTEWLNGLKRFS
ncbi:hypothetical protein C7N43_37355 [Sphingobacteriales bacterium UPWRP_1]|nr:hypothetical protein C7N43_37355 [Sphingobacteriales bacterium UPWRP_1]